MAAAPGRGRSSCAFGGGWPASRGPPLRAVAEALRATHLGDGARLLSYLHALRRACGVRCKRRPLCHRRVKSRRSGCAFSLTGARAGLEPHSVLPIATIAFHHGSPVLPASLEARERAGLASSAVFRVPLVKHLWSWLGLQSVDRRNMRCAVACASPAAASGPVRPPQSALTPAALRCAQTAAGRGPRGDAHPWRGAGAWRRAAACCARPVSRVPSRAF